VSAEQILRETEDRLRRHNQVLVELARRQGTLAEITEAAARTIGVERVGIWFFTPDRRTLRCADLYERTSNHHSSGLEMTAAGHAAYFRALETERSITAHDAQHDPRTASLFDSYLRHFGTASVIHTPIRHVGQIAGVLERSRSRRHSNRRRHPKTPLLPEGDLHRRQPAGAARRAIGTGVN